MSTSSRKRGRVSLQRLLHAGLTAVILGGVSCGPPTPPRELAPPPSVYRGESRYGLTFEERMAIPAELSRLKAEASRRADEMYDPYRSRENAIWNEETTRKLFTESKQDLLIRYDLTDEELEEINREYQASLGANVR